MLFECLSGRRLFDGRTTSETLLAVLSGNPDLSALPPETPDAAARLIGRCLVLEPRRRMRDVGEARLELERMLEGEASAGGSSVPGAAPRPLARAGGGRGGGAGVPPRP